MSKKNKFCRGFALSHLTQVVVWMVAVASAVFLFQHRNQRFEVLGIAQGQIAEVAATCTGRLKTVPVELFSEVEKGDIVAVIDTVLDDQDIESELKVITAEIQRLTAEVASTKDRLIAEADDRDINKTESIRRFFADVEDFRLEVLKIKVQIQTDMILLKDFELEVRIAKDLFEQEAISSYELQKAETAYNALAMKVNENQNLLTETEISLRHAQQRRDQYSQNEIIAPAIESSLEVIHKAIGVQQARIAELTARGQYFSLRAPISGVVNRIHCANGKALLAGEAILSITEKQPTEIIAYVEENRVKEVKQNMEVKLVKHMNPPMIAVSQIVSLGSAIEMMPERLWQNPDIAQWGRPILIKIPPEFKLFPGETVGVKGI